MLWEVWCTSFSLKKDLTMIFSSYKKATLTRMAFLLVAALRF